MEPTIDDLKESYSKYTDDELLNIATRHAKGLRTEAVDVMKNELRKRKLIDSVEKLIDKQFAQIEPKIILRYCDLLRIKPCPDCETTSKKLNATILKERMSFLIVSDETCKVKIACPDCLDKAHKRAIIITILFGWWSRRGIILTPFTIGDNIKYKKQNHQSKASETLKEYVENNIVKIEDNQNNNLLLQQLIKHPNQDIIPIPVNLLIHFFHKAK